MENIAVKNVSFRYKTAKANALTNINFSLEKGDFLVIYGQSGSGKTTLLRLLKKELAPNGYFKGDILYNGKPLSELDENDSLKIGFVGQNPDNQIVTDKVYSELAFGVESLGLSNEQIKIKIAEISEYFGISSLYNKSTYELSGGEKQLVCLASIMATSPDVLIFDEPTSMLDPIVAMELLKTIKRINEELGVTIILTEHRLENVFNMANKIMILKGGEIKVFDTPNMVIDNENLTEEMLYSMPTVQRLYSSLGGTAPSPLTIKEGKKYLENNLKVTQKSLQKEEERPLERVALEVKNGYFRYSKNDKDILKDFNLKVYEGEIFSIVGGNGTGKTTTLSCISGIKNLYSGKIKYFGKSNKEFRGANKKVTISLLPQNPCTLFVKDTVQADLEEIIKIAGYNKEEFKSVFNEVVDTVGVRNLLQSHPFDLSGGEQEKVALCKVLLMQPKILLLDEATKGLDAYYKRNLGDILLKLKNKGITIILVTHDIEFASKYSTRVGMMFNGELIAVNNRTDFFENNEYYTTASVKLSKGIFTNTVNADELIELSKINKSSM